MFTREPDVCAGDPDEVGKTWGLLPTDQVQVVRNEAALLLGSLKRGVQEAFSPAKAVLPEYHPDEGGEVRQCPGKRALDFLPNRLSLNFPWARG